MCLVCEQKLEDREEKNRIDCWGCPNIEVIPNIPGVTVIVCEECPKLRKIECISTLQYLYCRRCPKLREIPKIDNLIRLSCERCENLTEIPYMSNLMFLQCGYCVRLTKIPDMENLREISCRGCRLLTSFPLFKRTNGKIEPGHSTWTSYGFLDSYFPNIPYINRLDVTHCPWINTNMNYENNLKNLIKLQRYFKKMVLHKKFTKLIPTLTSIFYSPGCRGMNMARESFEQTCRKNK